jgi:hypothetical protein
MEKSESIVELSVALNKAQATMKPAKRSGWNPFFKTNYSTMSDIIESSRESLASNGLSFSQFPFFENGRVGVETILMHSSGEWMKGCLLLKIEDENPQACGSAISYAKRYSLEAILGIPSDPSIDDDGNAAMPKRINSQPQNAQYKTVANKCKCGNDIWGTYPRCRECNQKM